MKQATTWMRPGMVLATLLVLVAVLAMGAGAMLRAQSPQEAADVHEAAAAGEDAAGEADEAAVDAREGVVRVGRLIYGGGMTSKCFAEGFLALADRQMESNIKRQLEGVELNNEAIFQYPMIVMTGEGSFTLSKEERDNLVAYINRGGLLLASAGCSNASWSNSFRSQFQQLFPDENLERINEDHALFRTLFDIERIIVSRGVDADALYGMTRQGRLAVIFTPLGLNDTANAGGGCCCCGGNEVRNAREINANIVGYALTH